jgi:hypothetical protein
MAMAISKRHCEVMRHAYSDCECGDSSTTTVKSEILYTALSCVSAMVKGSLERLLFTFSERGGVAARFSSMIRRRLTKEQKVLRERKIYESQLQALAVDELAVNEEYGRCKRSKRGSIAVAGRYAGTLEYQNHNRRIQEERY